MINISKPSIGLEEKEAVLKVLDSGELSAGEEVECFEKEFANYIGCPYAIATSSGTSALHTMINIMNFEKDDEIITTPFTFIATINAIKLCGLKPVFADIDPLSFNIDPNSVEVILNSNPKIKAILIVHLFGQACQMDRIIFLCKKYNLYLLEDAAQAHGASYKGKRVGSFGLMSAFSFYATKNMITGEGGMIICNDKHTEKKGRLFINHGFYKKYVYEGIGYNYRMTNIEATIGRCQLKKLDDQNIYRRKNAILYNKFLSEVKEIILPKEMKHCYHVYHQYVIRVSPDVRKALFEYLKMNGVNCGIYYPKALHMNEKRCVTLPNAENVVNEVLALPVHPQLSEEQIKYISDIIINFYEFIIHNN